MTPVSRPSEDRSHDVLRARSPAGAKVSGAVAMAIRLSAPLTAEPPGKQEGPRLAERIYHSTRLLHPLSIPRKSSKRVGLLGTVEELIASDRLRPAFLFERCRVLRLSDADMLRDRLEARLDPDLESVRNLNEPADHQRAHALAPPDVEVELSATLAPRSSARRKTVQAWTLGAVASAIGLRLDEHVIAALNGDQITRDLQLPLAAGDTVASMAADAGTSADGHSER